MSQTALSSTPPAPFILKNTELNTTYDLPLEAGEYIKIYEVPLEYSTDGLFIAAWRHGEIEPYPACFGGDARLVIKGVIRADDAPAENGEGRASLKFEGEILDNNYIITAQTQETA